MKDPATTDVRRGWCRLMGLTAKTLFLASAVVVRNQRLLAAFQARGAEDARRLALGRPPKRRRRRRRTNADLVNAAPPNRRATHIEGRHVVNATRTAAVAQRPRDRPAARPTPPDSRLREVGTLR